MNRTIMSESFAVGIGPAAPRGRSAASVATTVGSDHVFEVPTKLIKTPADMKIWEKSEAYFEFLGFILAINEAVKGKSNSRGSENASEEVQKVIELLNKLDTKIDETPAVQQPQRFGNVAFRTWYQKLRDESLVLLQDVLPTELNAAVPEIVSYLVESFGNSTRIDYGTGHEISFIMFLCCLYKIGFLKQHDKTATGCAIFTRYLDLARKLQKTYRMEPAGSHGVWSLDDYQFVPFIWGSSQLFAHPIIEPSGFLVPQILNQYGEDFMFLTCIQYINSVKSGPFAEHSNQLWSISGVSSWTKINGGLIKMYKAEVLSKFPVVQHIVFGSLFTLRPMEQSSGMMTAKTSMVPPPVPFPARSSSTLGSMERESNESVKSTSIEQKKSVSTVSSKRESVQSSVKGSQVTDRSSVVSAPSEEMSKVSAEEKSEGSGSQGDNGAAN
ncbi:serine/threonine-protein phosphatase 2A activator [Tribolium castaneum]|nr:PREDICTED: serine/threonine-protein phosphatase 2A activator [Tribolium castaneum]|eukprot:XP_969405.2 PREDICTED: serine/threonine-protein phosphatase 2A activator [Tribolium castaneum]